MVVVRKGRANGITSSVDDGRELIRPAGHSAERTGRPANHAAHSRHSHDLPDAAVAVTVAGGSGGLLSTSTSVESDPPQPLATTCLCFAPTSGF